MTKGRRPQTANNGTIHRKQFVTWIPLKPGIELSAPRGQEVPAQVPTLDALYVFKPWKRKSGRKCDFDEQDIFCF